MVYSINNTKNCNLLSRLNCNAFQMSNKQNPFPTAQNAILLLTVHFDLSFLFINMFYKQCCYISFYNYAFRKYLAARTRSICVIKFRYKLQTQQKLFITIFILNFRESWGISTGIMNFSLNFFFLLFFYLFFVYNS